MKRHRHGVAVAVAVSAPLSSLDSGEQLTPMSDDSRRGWLVAVVREQPLVALHAHRWSPSDECSCSAVTVSEQTRQGQVLLTQEPQGGWMLPVPLFVYAFL